MREPGFYWVKEYNQGWVIAYFGGLYWWFAGLKYDYKDDEFDEIDERRIVREDDEKLTVGYLLTIHPELTFDLAKDLLTFSRKETIVLKNCYGDGSIMYPLWKAQLPK